MRSRKDQRSKKAMLTPTRGINREGWILPHKGESNRGEKILTVARGKNRGK